MWQLAMTAKQLKWTYLGLFFAFLIGLLVSAKNTADSQLFGAFALTFITFLWVRADARQRGFQLGSLFKVGVIILAVVFVPAYLIKSRGLRTASKSMAIFVGQVLGVFLADGLLFVVLRISGLTHMFR